MEIQTGSEMLASFIGEFTDHAIVMLDVEGRLLTWNAGAKVLMGYSQTETVGRYFVEFEKRDVSPGDVYIPLYDTLDAGRRERTTQLIHKDGTAVKVRIVSRPVHDREGRASGHGLFLTGFRSMTAVAPVGVDWPAPRVAPLPAKPKVLLVDDDSLVLEQVEEQLVDLGYEVASASSGAQALEILRQAPDVDLLFADVVMPNGMGGRELADKARQMRPDLKILFSSGYFRGALVKKGALDADVDCLAKPFLREQLAEKLDTMLRVVR